MCNSSITFGNVDNESNSFLLLFVMSFIMPVILFVTFSCETNKSGIVALVDNEPVTATELKHWILLNKTKVYNHFYRNYEIAGYNDFWEGVYNNKSPRQMLINLALEDAVRFKVQQLIALEKGIVSNIRYDDLIKEMNQVNLEREKSIEKGQPVYGPVQFTSRTYLAHIFDNMTYELKTLLSATDLKLEDRELEIMRIESNQLPGEIAGFLQMQHVDRKYDSYIDKLQNAANVKINTEVLNKICVK